MAKVVPKSLSTFECKALEYLKVKKRWHMKSNTDFELAVRAYKVFKLLKLDSHEGIADASKELSLKPLQFEWNEAN